MIPQSFIQELLTRVDIVEVVGRAVKLKKAGANYQGLCPFHNEKTPSFSVSPTKQFYHCFGCGAHGSAISFLMEHFGLGFVEAVHELAQGAGLTVPEDNSREGREAAQKASQQVALSQWLDKAAAYYRLRLKETPAAITYLKERGVTGETAKRFGLGYAPAGWRNLEGVLPDYAAEDAERSGLVVASEEGKRYDRFRERVMFPIRNPRGQIIGFGGRVLGQGEPKYLNSPEGPLFSKGHELYGLFEARDGIRASGRVLVVEGYMDVVMLHQYGCTYAVATLGTATTAVHITKLLRQADRIVFAFDGDRAGRRAAWRALENALPVLSDTKQLDFLFLPPEHDPDSFVREEGLEAFEAQVRDALPLSSFLLKELASRGDITTAEGRARMQAELKPLVLQMPDIALRTQILVDMAGRLGLHTEELAAYCGLSLARPSAAGTGRAGQGRRFGGTEGQGGARAASGRSGNQGRFAGGASRGGMSSGDRAPSTAGMRGMADRADPGIWGDGAAQEGRSGRAGAGSRTGGGGQDVWGDSAAPAGWNDSADWAGRDPGMDEGPDPDDFGFDPSYYGAVDADPVPSGGWGQPAYGGQPGGRVPGGSGGQADYTGQPGARSRASQGGRSGYGGQSGYGSQSRYGAPSGYGGQSAYGSPSGNRGQGDRRFGDTRSFGGGRGRNAPSGGPGAPGGPGGMGAGAGVGMGGFGGMGLMRPQPATLLQRVCLLLAYYPALAHEHVEDEALLPAGLLEWRTELAALPSGAHFASVLADVRAQSPEKAAFIEALDLKDEGVMSAMGYDEARKDYFDALDRLRLDQARHELIRTVSQGLEKPGVRTRYEELTAVIKRLSERGAG